MSTPHPPDGPPSVREIADLTARLRALTSRDGITDPAARQAERARFLADKRALLDRITADLDQDQDDTMTNNAPDDRADTDAEWWAQARSTDPGVPTVTFDASGYFSDAEIAEIAAAAERGDTATADRLRDRSHHDPAARPDQELVEVPMPEWMREQARATEADIAAGTYQPGPTDDPARIAARLDEIRGRIAARDAELHQHVAIRSTRDGYRADPDHDINDVDSDGRPDRSSGRADGEDGSGWPA